MWQEACPTGWDIYGRSILQVDQVVVLKHGLGVEHLKTISSRRRQLKSDAVV
jgi:hypothetical protein